MRLKCKCGNEFTVYDSTNKIVRCPECGQKYNNPLYNEKDDFFFDNDEQIIDEDVKYCSKCGAKIRKEAVICPKCGCEVEGANMSEDAKLQGSGLGFLLTFFLGLLGLILCQVLGDKKCKKASVITLCVSIGVSLLFVIIYFALIGSLLY